MIAELLALSIQGRCEHITTCGMPALSLWLNATGAPGEIAAGAGSCVRVLQHVHTHCIDGREDLIGQQIEDTLDPDSSTPPYRRFASRNFFELLFR
jgi:hypothetical protein